MAIDWSDLQTVLALVRHGSLAAAGAELGVNYTTVARRITRAETAHGGALFERLADGYRPTEAAHLIAERAAEMEASELHLRRQLAGRDEALSGRLVITAPQLLIAYSLAPVLGQFRIDHPGIELKIRATNDLLDLTRREADLAVRISRDPGDSLKGQRLCAQDSAAFSTREWAERFAADPKGPIDWVAYEAYQKLPDEVLARSPGSRIVMWFDDMVAIRGAAIAGLGVARMPMFLGRSSPDLVQLPLLDPAPYPEIWTVAHRDVWPGAKPTAFRAALKAHFKDAAAHFRA